MAMMNASLVLAVAVLCSVFSSNMAIPLVHRRQTAELCNTNHVRDRSDFSDTDSTSVCVAGECQLPRRAYAGIPFGPIVNVDYYACCEGYTRQGAAPPYVCVRDTTPSSTTAPPATNSATSSSTTAPPATTAATSRPSTVTSAVTSAPTPGTPPSSQLICQSYFTQTQFVNMTNVCPENCQLAFGMWRLPVTNYQCCSGYVLFGQSGQYQCLSPDSVVTMPPPSTQPTTVTTESVTNTEGTTSTQTPVPVTSQTPSSTETTVTTQTPSSTETTVTTQTPSSTETTSTTATSEQRCTEDFKPLGTYINTPSNRLCEVVCFTQQAYAGIPFGPKKYQTRYECCQGYEAVRAYPNHPTNFSYQCVQA